MNEASSRFVDQLVLEKLLTEKLQKVHHYPESGIHFPQPLFADWNQYAAGLDNFNDGNFGFAHLGNSDFVVESKFSATDGENRQIPVKHYPAQHPVMNLVLYHGLFEENREIYLFLFKNLNFRGINVFLVTLPFHYERVTPASRFSGEYFWSANFERTRNAFKQSVYDLHLIKLLIEQRNELPVIIGGFSMGAAVALVYAACHQLNNRIVALNPPVSLSGIIWNSALCSNIKEDYLQSGYQKEELACAYREFEPIAYDKPATPVDNIFLGYGCFDQVTDPDLYMRLIQQWGLGHFREYKCGHMNLLRVPRVADDIFLFGSNDEQI